MQVGAWGWLEEEIVEMLPPGLSRDAIAVAEQFRAEHAVCLSRPQNTKHCIQILCPTHYRVSNTPQCVSNTLQCVSNTAQCVSNTLQSTVCVKHTRDASGRAVPGRDLVAEQFRAEHAVFI